MGVEENTQWEDLRREARKLEGDLDVKLSSYSKLGSMLSHGGEIAAEGSWKSMEMEIEALLEKLQDVNDAMSRCVAGTTSTMSVSQKLARHRDILHEYTQEFRRTRGHINSAREHVELLSSVRNDISEFKSDGASSSLMSSLLRERGAIHGNLAQLEDVINQAQVTKSTLAQQRMTFTEISSRMSVIADKLPMVRSLLGLIKRKKSKDTIILSLVIAACTIFLIVYWLYK
ncbi:hypothetical protein CBR_g20431 [Chara braunii]|uniref:Golgi SNAP receptor complex member 1 n=1 Tax=Chara braunii TaxID=69332 RepID=A0A388JUE5_CHABU|nr:hypothetical protein CBR_g20431 [Chara braunii]|eukprot:GBG61400.1 hypothetical protein CBR_g20431 [Chara braunii]